MCIRDRSLSFGGVKAVQNVTLSVEEDSITSIIGPNGAGKTTFFNLVSGVYSPTSGEILFDNENITGLKQHQIDVYKRQATGYGLIDFICQRTGGCQILITDNQIFCPVQG